MKITSTALFLIAVGALGASEAARDGSLARRRTLEQSNDDAAAVRIIPANEEDEARAGQDEPFPIGKKRKSSKGQVANTPTAIITNFRKKCYYVFDDEDEYELIPGADSGMTCANNVCNVDFVGDNNNIDEQDGTANRIIGLKLTPTSNIPDEIAGTFFVGCPSIKKTEEWKAAFTCPSGYYVKSFRTRERIGGGKKPREVTAYSGCSTNVTPGKQDYRRQVCTEFLSGIPAEQNYYYTLTCKEIAVPV